MDKYDTIHFKTLCEIGTLEMLPKGHVFYDYYENQDYIYCLDQGVCALMSLKECGKEHIYYYLKPGSLICLVPAFLNSINQNDLSPDPYFTIVAKSPCKVYKVHRTAFYDLLATSPELVEFIVLSITDTSRNLLKHFYTALEGNAVSKIALSLLTLSETYEGETVLHKEFNYNEIAKYLGVHHITVARIIMCLKEEGIISKRGRQIIILDKEELLLYSKNKKVLHY